MQESVQSKHTESFVGLLGSVKSLVWRKSPFARKFLRYVLSKHVTKSRIQCQQVASVLFCFQFVRWFGSTPWFLLKALRQAVDWCWAFVQVDSKLSTQNCIWIRDDLSSQACSNRGGSYFGMARSFSSYCPLLEPYHGPQAKQKNLHLGSILAFQTVSALKCGTKPRNWASYVDFALNCGTELRNWTSYVDFARVLPVRCPSLSDDVFLVRELDVT